MRILMLAHFAGSPRHGMVYGHYHLAREWVRSGHDVTIVAAAFAHTRHRQPDCARRTCEEWIDGIRYRWLRVPRYAPQDRLGRVLNILSFTLRVAFLRTEPVDAVILSSHFPLPIFAALRLARRDRAMLVFEVRDLWPLTLIELGGASRRNPLIQLMQWAEDTAYRRSDLVVSVLPNAKDYMTEHGLEPAKFLFVPNGVDLTAQHEARSLPAHHRSILDQLQRSRRFLVGYSGRIGLANALHSLIDAAASDPAVQVVLLGEGSHATSLLRQAQALGIAERVTLLPPVDRSQVNDFLSRMDALYIGLQRQPLFRFGVSPTKLHEYMLAAKPVLYAIDAPGDIIAESGAGVSCRAEDPAAIAAAIGRLRKLPKPELAKMGQRGRQWVHANRDYRVLAHRFMDSLLAYSPAQGHRQHAESDRPRAEAK